MSEQIASVDISRASKVLFPADGITKGGLTRYYADVAETMLTHLSDRPVTMQRFPDGVDGQGFYEKRLPEHFPNWMDDVRVDTRYGSQRQVVVTRMAHLVYLADQACITPHVWLSGRTALDYPDQLIFDLDPSGEDLDEVRAAARAVRDALEAESLSAFVKTTGSRGYHVHAPLDGTDDFDTVRDAAQRIARSLAEDHPDRFTVEQRKDKRAGRLYLDVMRNAYGQTAIAPYAVRARAGAPVATPIEWDELSRVTPDHYTTASVPRRLTQRTDPWAAFADHASPLAQSTRKV